MSRRLLSVAVALAFLASGLPAAAQVSGLVLEVTGTTEPQVAPYTELATGEVIKLAPNATLKVVHYRSCRTVAMTGGTLQAGASDFTMRGGTVGVDDHGRCPQRGASTASAGGVSGLVMRDPKEPAPAVSQDSKSSNAPRG